jgi:nucleotide-binding universal stress UspA family protein
MNTILVCYEERPVAHRVIERTAELAKAFAAKVIVTSVAPLLHTKGVGPFDPADPPVRHREEVEDAVARLSELGVTDVDAVVGAGDPTAEILELAEARKVDLIVIGAHEGGLVSRVLEGGSVGDAVSHKAHTDVLIVH